MQLHKDSHLDHGLSRPAIAWLVERFKDRTAFFIETIELPAEIGAVECGLYGPIVGDAPVAALARMATRGGRAWKSRVIGLPKRQTRTVTVVAGPHAGLPCVLYTVYGGPCAPREPGDIRAETQNLEQLRRPYWKALGENPRTISNDELAELKAAEEAAHAKIIALRPKREESDAFWSQHALAVEAA